MTHPPPSFRATRNVPVFRVMANDHRMRRSDFGTAKSPSFGGGQGGPRIDIDAAQVTYYESGALATATSIRRTEWGHNPASPPERRGWMRRVTRWIIDFFWMGLCVATCAGGAWGAWTLFGWAGLILSLLALSAFLASGNDGSSARH